MTRILMLVAAGIMAMVLSACGEGSKKPEEMKSDTTSEQIKDNGQSDQADKSDDAQTKQDNEASDSKESEPASASDSSDSKDSQPASASDTTAVPSEQ